MFYACRNNFAGYYGVVMDVILTRYASAPFCCAILTSPTLATTKVMVPYSIFEDMDLHKSTIGSITRIAIKGVDGAIILSKILSYSETDECYEVK